jgi:FkbM family methyltransferase
MHEFPPFNRVKQCRHGMMLYNFHDIYIGRSLELYGEFSEGEVDLFRQILKPGMVAVEVGSNIGAHTVFIAQAVAPGGFVLAFEPQRLVYQTLCANLALNSIVNVDARNLAVGAAPGELMVPVLDYNQDNNFGGLELGKHRVGECVRVITLDSLNLPRCDFLKIDVEGMEKSVLDGAAATIARCQPVLYVENDRKHKSAALTQTIDALGYRMWWHVPPLFNLDNFAQNSVNVFGRIASFNMLCLPKTAMYKMENFESVVLPLSESSENVGREDRSWDWC